LRWCEKTNASGKIFFLMHHSLFFDDEKNDFSTGRQAVGRFKSYCGHYLMKVGHFFKIHFPKKRRGQD